MAVAACLISARSRGRSAVSLSLLHRCFASSLDQWQRRCDRLTQLQRRIRFPHPQTFSVDGQNVELPLKAVAPTRSPRKEELEYLVGFFDGDGCVSMTKSSGGIALSVGQNIDAAAVLVHFRSLLGGGVSRHKQATGSSKAALMWCVTGPNMMNAATVLGSVASMKQAQLEIAARGCVKQDDRDKVEKELQLLKQPGHVPRLRPECSWPYLAGFFDAEGCIAVRAGFASLTLTLFQLNTCILDHLRHFVHENKLEGWTLHRRSGCSYLTCKAASACKQTLEQLLAHGLLVKRRQAQLALKLTKENHLQVRAAIASLSGLQKRYQRLDGDGIARAKEIQKLRNETYRTSGAQLIAMQQQLDELRAKHRFQNLVSRCHLLRQHMRQALQEGGQVTRQPATAQECKRR